MQEGWRRHLPSTRSLVVLYVVTGVVAGLVSHFAHASQNLAVFRDASLALTRGEDLYVLRSADYYKYSPTFALAFLPFAIVPWIVAAALWPALNFGACAWGMVRACRAVWTTETAAEQDARARWLLALAWPGIVLTTDGDQSNLLVAGACLGALAFLLEDRHAVAAPLLAFAILVKLFPAALGVVWLADRRRTRAVASVAVATAGLALLPALVVGPAGLAMEYRSWWALIARDRGPAIATWSSWSVMHAFDAIGLGVGAMSVQAAGTLLFLAGAAAFGATVLRAPEDAPFRREASFRFVAATFAYALLFNHRSESPTYVLASIAGAMFVVAQKEIRAWHVALLALVVVAASPIHSAYRHRTIVGILSGKRLFHPLRIVPLFFLWIALELEIARPLWHGRGLVPRGDR